MKRFTKFAAALLVLCMIVSIVPAAFAAAYEGEPGKTVNVVFEIKNIIGIDGDITLNDPNGIVASSKIAKVDTTLYGNYEGNKMMYSALVDLTATSFKLTYAVTLKASAMSDESCTVKFLFRTSDTNFELSDWKEETRTVVVKEAPKPTQTQATQATQTQATQAKPTQTQATQAKPTQTQATQAKPAQTQATQAKPAQTQATQATQAKPAQTQATQAIPAQTQATQATQLRPTEPVATQPASKVDGAELQKLIDAAAALDASAYTDESWAKLEAALYAARQALKSGNQNKIDAAAKPLQEAMDGLVALDMTALKNAIEKAEGFLQTDTIGIKAQELISALAAAKELLNSRDQAAIDAGAELLLKVFEELQKAIANGGTITEVDKIVEVEPEGPYCNISMHYVWPILFFISLLVNIVFIVLTVGYFVRRKKETDDTPLVDYDIGDDALDETDASGSVEKNVE